ncbi:MAG: TIGR04141 family sporadically distributed protein, partial [Pseudomonadota bacterium]|nr:TIGR04141 family sporadically distributed protein [Pseudomonadota bacterium]
MGNEKIGLSVYLLRSGAVESVEKTLFSNAVELAGGIQGRFAPIHSDRKEPVWLKAIRPFLADSNNITLLGESPAGLLLTCCNAHWLVITFGHAWQRLEPQWVEFDFGRRVALNAVPPDRVLEVNSEQVFAKWHLARERSPRATSVKEFALEHDRDLVAAVEGTPLYPILGSTVRGSTSLRLNLPIGSLGAALDLATTLFAKDDYKKLWPEIDNIVPISDDARSATLDALLDADLQSGVAATKAVLFTPALRQGDYSSADAYSFGRISKNSAKAPYLLYSAWELFLSRKGRTPSLIAARESPVHLFDSSGESIDRKSVYDCLGYEVAHEDRQ